MSDEAEQTGPHPRIAQNRDGALVLNTRSMLMIGAFLLGGMGSGGGVALMRPAVPDELVQSVKDASNTAEEIKTLGRNLEAQLADVRLTLVRMQAALDQRGEQSRTNAEALKDHELRLRALERRASRGPP